MHARRDGAGQGDASSLLAQRGSGSHCYSSASASHSEPPCVGQRRGGSENLNQRTTSALASTPCVLICGFSPGRTNRPTPAPSRARAACTSCAPSPTPLGPLTDGALNRRSPLHCEIEQIRLTSAAHSYAEWLERGERHHSPQKLPATRRSQAPVRREPVDMPAARQL